MGTLLRNIRPVFGPDGTLSVRLEEGVVVGVRQSEIAEETGDVVIEGDGKLAFSGFVNAHTHLAMVLLRGLADDVPLQAWLEDYVWPIERTLQPEDVYWCTLLALAEAIRGGTTCVADMYFHTDAVARAVEESGLRALISYGVIAESFDAKGRAELATARKVVERWNGAAAGRIATALSPHAVYTCGEDVWREAIAAAREFGVRIHTHLAETRREVEEWEERTGESPVAYLDRIGAFEIPTLAAHCVHVSREDIAAMARGGVSVAHCPKSNAKLGSGIAPLTAMREAGIPVALGTDGAASNNRLDMLEELRAAWALQRASREDAACLSGHDAITMATEAGRAALGMPPGGLEVGAAADVVLVDSSRSHMRPRHAPISALAYAAGSSDVTDVIVDGRILMRAGELLTIDEERVQSEVERVLRRH
jgi:5-methylthioadenosine/S-adenosylhomocysteine deaminase